MACSVSHPKGCSQAGASARRHPGFRRKAMPEPPRSIHSECLKIDVKAPGLTTSAYLLSDRIRALFQTCQFFDVHLRVGNARFPAHQAVLAAMSDWLRLNLKSLLEEEEGSDQLPQIRLERISNPDAVMILLDAAYELGPKPSDRIVPK